MPSKDPRHDQDPSQPGLLERLGHRLEDALIRITDLPADIRDHPRVSAITERIDDALIKVGDAPGEILDHPRRAAAAERIHETFPFMSPARMAKSRGGFSDLHDGAVREIALNGDVEKTFRDRSPRFAELPEMTALKSPHFDIDGWSAERIFECASHLDKHGKGDIVTSPAEAEFMVALHERERQVMERIETREDMAAVAGHVGEAMTGADIARRLWEASMNALRDAAARPVINTVEEGKALMEDLHDLTGHNHLPDIDRLIRIGSDPDVFADALAIVDAAPKDAGFLGERPSLTAEQAEEILERHGEIVAPAEIEDRDLVSLTHLAGDQAAGNYLRMEIQRLHFADRYPESRRKDPDDTPTPEL